MLKTKRSIAGRAAAFGGPRARGGVPARAGQRGAGRGGRLIPAKRSAARAALLLAAAVLALPAAALALPAAAAGPRPLAESAQPAGSIQPGRAEAAAALYAAPASTVPPDIAKLLTITPKPVSAAIEGSGTGTGARTGAGSGGAATATARPSPSPSPAPGGGAASPSPTPVPQTYTRAMQTPAPAQQADAAQAPAAPTPVPQTYTHAMQTPAPAPVETVSEPTPTPTPTAPPMLQEIIREGVESASIDIKPTPPRASENAALSLNEAVSMARSAAEASLGSLELAKLNSQRQAASLNSSVSAATRALETDDRYKLLKKEEKTYGDNMAMDLRMELDAYEQMEYKELNTDERRQLASTRDYALIQLNDGIAQIGYNIEILDNGQAYSAWAAYSSVAKLQSAIALQQEALDLQKSSLDALKKRYELGAASKTEADSAELSYDKAAISLGQTKRSLASALISLNRLIGENLATTYADFDRSQLRPAKATPRLQDYLDGALSKRSEILIAARSRDLAEGQAGLFSEAPYKPESVHEGQESALSAEEAAIAYDMAVSEVESEIRSAYKQLLSLRGQISYNESQVAIAQSALERAQKQRDLGLATQLSVDSAAITVAQAKIQLENSTIDVWLQERKLEIISGIGPGGL